MISEEQIDWAIRVLESSRTAPETKEAARKMAEAYVRQEERTLAWMHQCYLSRDVARMAEQRYGNRANRAGTR